MAKREVKPALKDSGRTQTGTSWSGKGAKVKRALTPPKEERGKRNRGKVKRAMGR